MMDRDNLILYRIWALGFIPFTLKPLALARATATSCSKTTVWNARPTRQLVVRTPEMDLFVFLSFCSSDFLSPKKAD